jgi:signal transduction histidine kinase
VQADPRLIRHILSNLLDNAVKYSPPDSNVSLEMILEAERVTFRVVDEGFGVQPDDEAHLFEPFFRGSNTSHLSGTGLGLKIVQDSVELHGGSIRFTSVPKQGTTFVVSLPVLPA